MHDSAVEMESPAGGEALPAPEPVGGANDPWAELERGMRDGSGAGLVVAGREEPGLELMPDVVQQRSPRVRFKHPVRVVPLGGSPRAYRLLSSNLSSNGMFLAMPTPLEPGTRVALSLEAGGRVLPFAEAEVRWKRLQPQKGGAASGFGVRFVNYLHPRAQELVQYLVANLDTGKPLPEPEASRRGRLWLGTMIAAAGFAAAAALVFVMSRSVPPEGAEPAAVAAAPQWQPAPPAPRVSTMPELDLAATTAGETPPSAATPAPAAETPNAAAAGTAPGSEVALASAAPAAPPVAPKPPEAEAPSAAASARAPQVAAKSGAEGSSAAAPARAPQIAAKPPAPELEAPAAAAPARAPQVAAKPPAPGPQGSSAAALARATQVAAKPPAVAAKPAAPPAKAPAKPAPAKEPPRVAVKGPAESPPRAAVPTNTSARVARRAQVIPLTAAGAAAKLLVEDARGELRVTVEPIANGKVAKVFTLDGPPRVVFDIEGGAPKKSLAVTLSGKQIKQVRVGKLGQGTRVVVDLAKKPSDVTQEGDAAILSY